MPFCSPFAGLSS